MWGRLYCPAMNFLDLDALGRAPVATKPFPYLVAPGFVPEMARAVLSANFPRIDTPGSFPVSSLAIEPAFRDFLAELDGAAFRDAIGEKLGIDLGGRPTMVTVRGHAGPRDGNIHADSKSKLVTVLIYLNEAWEASGGRLRLLRSARDLDDMVAEVPPDAGTLLAFRVTPHSWHGHALVIGPRRVIQLNWVTDDEIVRREQARHGFSAKVKRFLAFAK